ncbi:MAG TPA: SRPBCC family protein [Pseudonocardiaceae bacterium]|jgi:uncharacterized membrane protein
MWVRSVLVAIPLLVTGLLGVPAQAAPASLTCQGQGIDQTAVLHHEAETFIKAPLGRVWQVQTDVTGWPRWQSAVSGMRKLDRGPLRPGSRFRWTSPAPATASTPATTLVVTSTVRNVQRDRCIRWMGPAIGQGLRIDRGTHVWNFVPVRGGVIVRTEESWTGQQIESDPATAIKYLAPGLDLWLADLKKAAEAR